MVDFRCETFSTKYINAELLYKAITSFSSTTNPEDGLVVEIVYKTITDNNSFSLLLEGGLVVKNRL